jgi:CRISPR-associated protein Cas1
LDMEEEFRPVIVDALVLGLVRAGTLRPEDFGPSGDGGPGVWLSGDARRFFIASYEERLAVKVQHPGWGRTFTYRQCLDLQVEHMARCIAGRDAAYQPLLSD